MSNKSYNPYLSDLEHWRIEATVYKDRVEEIHYISDPAKGVRRKPQKKIWKVKRLLGRGSFGEVRLETNEEEGNMRAVKRVATMHANLSNSECEKELKALLEFSKPKSRQAAVFVDFYGWFRDGSDIFLAMEYVSLGDLEKNISRMSGKVPEPEARDIAEQILSGLEIMHMEAFTHRDLKPQNVLVVRGAPNWWVKLADFGLSKRLIEGTGLYTRAGTQSYMAPEVLNYLEQGLLSSEYTNAVDLWALGCIVYRLVTGVVPFPPGPSLVKYCEDKSLFPYDDLFDSGIKSKGSKFIRNLLATHPKARPSASQALQHEWIVSGPTTENQVNATRKANPPIDRDFVTVKARATPPSGHKIAGKKVEASSAISPEVSKSHNSGYNTATHLGLKSRVPLPTIEDDTVRAIPLATDQDIHKKFRDLTYELEKYQLDAYKSKERAQNAEKRAHNAERRARSMLACRSFKEGDLALFLPAKNPGKGLPRWKAFSTDSPYHFLRAEASFNLETREWLVARIQRIEERVVTPSDNPFDLLPGLHWYLLDAVEEKSTVLSAAVPLALAAGCVVM